VAPKDLTLKKGAGKPKLTEEEKKEAFKRKAQTLFFVGIILVVFILFPFTIATYTSV